MCIVFADYFVDETIDIDYVDKNSKRYFKNNSVSILFCSKVLRALLYIFLLASFQKFIIFIFLKVWGRLDLVLKSRARGLGALQARRRIQRMTLKNLLASRAVTARQQV